MTTPSRLSQEGGGADSFEVSLLGSARSDGASANRGRTLAALALAGVAGAAAVGTGAATKTTGVVLKTIKSLGWLKGMAIIGLGLSVAGGVSGLVALNHHAQRADQARAAIAPASETERPSVVEPVPVKEPSALPGPAAAPSLVQPPEETTPRPRVARAASRSIVPADSLLVEASLLDRARQQLVQRDGVGATRIAEEYLARFPRGRLASEAEVIRIHAALLTGGHAAAAPLAQAFVRAHPDSPHGAALQKILHTPPAAGGP